MRAPRALTTGEALGELRELLRVGDEVLVLVTSESEDAVRDLLVG